MNPAAVQSDEDPTSVLRNSFVSTFVAEAIRQEMEEDDSILVIGEDVAKMGGVFGSTRGLHAQFGHHRVRDTPVAEMSFAGMGVGLAMAGYRPLVEIMFVDFIGVCLEQVYNAAAKIHYMSGGRVRMPLVFKTAGGTMPGGAQHSQCLWGLFAHLPGLKVVVPSCPHDYKGLMAASLQCDDPVVFIEHKKLLGRRAERFRHGRDVPAERYVIELGKASVVRPGSDLTIVTLGLSVGECLKAADELAGDGIEAEVIDLRTVVPLDVPTVAESVERTGRLLVVDEDYRSFGLSGEVVARTLETVGTDRVRAVARCAVPDAPIGASPTLERALMPTVDKILGAARGLL